MEIDQSLMEIQVPTHDSRVRNWLRVLGQPVTLFGEDSRARKARLKSFLSGLESADVDEANFDSEVEGQEFFSAGINDLRQARHEILAFSLERAKKRIKNQLLELDVPFATRKMIRHDLYNSLFVIMIK